MPDSLLDYGQMAMELCRDEDTILFVYDDATGQKIGPGSHVIGNPTIGTGRNLSGKGISETEARDLLWADMAEYAEQLGQLPWFMALDPARRRAIMNMRHQLGLMGLGLFRVMIRYLQQGDYDNAARAGLNSQWAKQTPARAERVMRLLRYGDAPPAIEVIPPATV